VRELFRKAAIKVIAVRRPTHAYADRPQFAGYRQRGVAYALSFLDRYGWRPLEAAPRGQDVQLFVEDDCGSAYPPSYPCRLTDRGWINSSTGSPLEVTPLGWKPLMSQL
jgi:hypothetical protein